MCVWGPIWENWGPCDFSFILRDGRGLYRNITVNMEGVLPKKQCLEIVLWYPLFSILLP